MVWYVVLAVLVPSCIAGVHNALGGRYDFSWFYADARHLATGGDMTESVELEWYLPGFRVLLAPMGLLPAWLAAFVWNGVNATTAALAIGGIARCARMSSPGPDGERHAAVATVLAILFVAPAAFGVFQINQISFWPLALLVWAHIFALERRERTAGLLLGLAILVKLLPAVMLVWCILRKRVRMALVAAMAPVILSIGIDAAVYGSAAAGRHHVHWYRIAFTGSAGAGFLERGKERSHRNQGLPVVLGRLLQPTPTLNTRPLPWSEQRRVRRVEVASLDTATIKAVYVGVAAVSFVGFVAASVWVGRRPGPLAEHGLFALWCVAMMWFAPLMRQYYLVWALPAVWVLLDQAGRHGRARTRGWACLAALAAWGIGLAGWAIPEFRAVGGSQWVNLVMIAALAWEGACSRRSERVA